MTDKPQPAVGTVCFRGEDVLLIRRGTKPLAGDWSMPGGRIEFGERAEAAALRELAEETGFVGERARLLARVHPNPAFMANRCHLVLVENCRLAAAPEWDADEEIVVSAPPVAEVFARARAGEITHSLVLDALFFFEPIWRAGASRAAV